MANYQITSNIAMIRAAHRQAAPLHAARIAALIERNRQAAIAANLSNFFAAVAEFAATQTKPEFITKKALIAACKNMEFGEVLFSAQRRTNNHRGYAVEVALSHFFTTTFGQQFHAVRNGAAQVANPRWFRQLYTDLAWSAEDITPMAILQALA